MRPAIRPALALALLALALPACAQQPRPSAAADATGAAPAKPAAPNAAGVPVGFPQYPSVSPDGSTIVFSWGGDLWAVPAAGGLADRLTSNPADEMRSAFSPDGSMLAFESERDGTRNIYVMPLVRASGSRTTTNLTAGAVRRVTMSDRAQALGGFSADGTRVYYASAHEPAIFRSSRLYAAPIPPEGATSVLPIERLTDAFGAAPHASADGSRVVFHRTRHDATRPIYAGSGAPDVWSLDLKTGGFTQITTDARPDAEGWPMPDGSTVFLSSRSGQFNLWRAPRGGGAQVQITDFKPAAGETTIAHGVRDLAVAPGGTIASFVVWDTLYTIDLAQAKPEPKPVRVTAGGDAASSQVQRVSAGRLTNTAVLSPDGKTLATIARGEIFVRSVEKDRPTRRVTGTGLAGAARARDLAWSPDGRVLYFTTDNASSTGVSMIAQATVALTRDDIRPDEKKPADPAGDAKKDDAKKDEPKDDSAAETEKKDDAPTARGPAARTRPAARKDDPGQRWAEAVTFTVSPLLSDPSQDLSSPLPSPDGKWLLVSRGYGDLVRIDLAALAKHRAERAGDLAIPAAAERTLLKSWTEAEASWAADSRHIVYAVQDVDYNSDIWLMDALADTITPVNLTRHPDFDTSPRLSADGKVLYFLSDRDSDTNGQNEVFAINLDRKLDGLRPYELADYFKDAAENAKKRKPLAIASAKPAPKADADKPAEKKPDDKAEPKPAEGDKPAKPEDADAKKPAAKAFEYDAGDLETAYRRVRKITGVPDRVGNLAITPGGERIVFTAAIEPTTTNVLSFDYSGKDRRTVFAGPASDISSSLTGERLVFISSGRSEPAGATPPEDRPRPTGGDPYLGRPVGGEADRLGIEAPLAVDIEAQQKQKFLEASRLMGVRFYHPTMKGLDWGKICDRYLSLATRTRSDAEFNRLFNMLLGELDASHMGMSGGRDTSGPGVPLGYLGIDFKPVLGGFEVTRVIANAPADRNVSRLAPGDVIRAVNGAPLAAPGAMPSTDLLAALQGTVGQETLLDLAPRAGQKPEASATRHVLITPISAATDGVLRYQDSVIENARKVREWSGGRLGYLHIRGMDLASARDFERDLFAAAQGKDGLLIDVRDNGGGSTADILLSSLTAPRHATTFARGQDLNTLPNDAYPRDRRLIYGYSRPISVLINQNSFSNAEIFAHAIKTIGRGKLVGTATFGGVISTGSHTLIDGTTMRTPFRGWWLPGRIDMENHGAEPDIAVPQTPQDEAAGNDRQLEAAVKELLERVKK